MREVENFFLGIGFAELRSSFHTGGMITVSQEEDRTAKFKFKCFTQYNTSAAVNVKVNLLPCKG